MLKAGDRVIIKQYEQENGSFITKGDIDRIYDDDLDINTCIVEAMKTEKVLTIKRISNLENDNFPYVIDFQGDEKYFGEQEVELIGIKSWKEVLQ
jgi:hypothetical protein